jgi:LysR family cys regulon transcriptional activator
VKLRQLRYVLEVHRRGNHISAAAEALHTSQPGMSKQIQLLESELGFAVFQRKRNRVVGLTEPGREVIAIAQRIVNDIANLRAIREDFSAKADGSLTVATTHTYARYILPKVVENFITRYPSVRLGLHQGNPTQICEAVEAGEADLAVGTETLRPFPNLVMLPCIEITRSVVAKKGHPLLKVKNLTLAEIAKYPIITHDRQRSGRWKVMDAFTKEGITPNVTFGSLDADVSKAYVAMGLGIAILATVAVDAEHNPELGARDASHLFQSSTTYISLRPHSYLRRYVLDFIAALAPNLTPDVVREALHRGGGGEHS